MPAPTGPTQTPVHGTNTGTTLVLTFGSNPAAGASVAVLVGYESGSVSSVAGCGATWTKGVSAAGGFDIWIGLNCAGSAKVVTITVSTSQKIVGNASDWGNTPIATAVDAVTFGTGQTPSQVAFGLTLGYANAVILAGIASNNGGTLSGLPPGFTALTGGTLSTLAMTGGYQIVSNGAGSVHSLAGWIVTGSVKFWSAAALSLKGKPRTAIALTTSMAGSASVSGSVRHGGPPSNLMEVRVLDGSQQAMPVLAILENARETSWHDPFNDIGSGTTKLPLSDPKAVNLVPGNLVAGYLNGLERFRWWADAPIKTLAAPEGSSGEFWEFAGRGFEAYLERGILYPPGGWKGFRFNARAVKNGFPSAVSDQKVGPWPVTLANAIPTGQWLIALAEAMQGYGMLPFLRWDFTESVDSAGNPWSTALTVTMNVGDTFLSLVKALRKLGATITLRRDFVLQAWELTNAVRHLENQVVLRAGRHITPTAIQHTRPTSQLRSRMLAMGQSGYYAEVISAAQEAIPLIGVRAGYVGGPAALATGGGYWTYPPPTSGSTVGAQPVWNSPIALAFQPTIIQAGQQALLQSQQYTESISVPFTHDWLPGGYEPYAHFDRGDWIALDVPGTWDRAPYQVAAIGIQQQDENGYLPTIDLGTVKRKHLLELQRKLDNAGFGS